MQKGDLETLKVLLKTKEEKNPVIYSDNSLGELTVLDTAAYFGHLNITIWYKDVLGFSDINPKDNKTPKPQNPKTPKPQGGYLWWRWQERGAKV